jgi:hypothetical protein
MKSTKFGVQIIGLNSIVKRDWTEGHVLKEDDRQAQQRAKHQDSADRSTNN